jgi:peptidoglycan/LPS O-acetylase OafA/YrhL
VPTELVQLRRHRRLTPVDHHGYLAQHSFRSLDGLRTLAIVPVVWHHTAAHVVGWPIVGRGYMGVDLFFVVSGFLIVTLLLRERQRTSQISLRNFYVRRLLRIFPLYYGFLALLALFAWTFGRGGSQADMLRADIPIAAVYLSNWVVVHGLLEMTWSLAAEEQFYLVWPVIERFTASAALWVLGAALVVSWSIPHVFVDAPSMLKETTFAPILLGVLLAHLLHRPTTFAAVARLVGHRLAPVILAILIVGGLCWPASQFHGFPRQITQIMMVAFLASVVVNDDHTLQPLLRAPPIMLIGTLSYGIYILHLVCRHVAVAMLSRLGVEAPVVLFATTLAMSVVAAFASYHTFEKRVLALKARFST